MTTQVTVLNNGPDSINVSTPDKDGENIGLIQTVEPGSFVIQHVHDGQDIRIEEVKEPAESPEE